MTRHSIARLAGALALLLLPAAARASAVTGRVLDTAGAPVAGVKVVWEAYRTDEETLVDETAATAPAPIGETATDAEGRFRIALDKPGVEVSIRVLPGNLPGALLGGPYDSTEDAALGDVELSAAEKVSGRVSDEAGKPVAGARVRAYGGMPFEEEDVTLYAEATTGVDGSFTIANAPASGGRVTARAKGYSPATQTSFRERVTSAKLTLRTGGSVAGTVVDAAGKPVVGAIVLSGALAVNSDASGAFRLAGVPAGAQPVEAFWKDSAARSESVRVKKGETAEVALRLGRSALVTGTVVDEKTRRPIAGVRVSTASGSFAVRASEPARRARTDAKGKFRLVGLRPRAYTIRAAKTDYLTGTMPGVVAGVATPGTVAIALPKSASIAGRVTDQGGKPVPGARVRIARDSGIRALMRAGGPAALFGRSGVTTGPDGAFRLRGLTAQRNVTLEAAKAGFVPAKRFGMTVKSGENVKDVDLVMKRGLEARGRVVDSAGQPISGAEVRLSRPEGGMSRVMIQMGGMGREKPDASSGADGYFRVAGLEAGEYAVAVSREGYALKRVPSVTVQAEGSNDWPPFVLTSGVAVGGFVRNGKGEPIVGAAVSSFREGAGPQQATTDPEGRFRLEGLSPERPTMLFVNADGYASLQRNVTPPTEELALVLKNTATIRGRVEDAGTNKPITDFTAAAREPRGAGMGGMRIVMGGGQSDKTFQSPDGSFELTDVAPGRWSVSASSPGYRPTEIAGIEVAEGETKEGVVLQLKKGAVVTGRVLDPRRSTGVPNASVSWEEGSGARGAGMAALARLDGSDNSQVTDADGRFRFEGLPSGRITLAAQHPDYLEVSKPVEVEDEAAVDLTLSLGGSIAGAVVGKDGRTPVGGAQVLLDEQGGTFSFGPETSRADASGSFLFEHLKPGRYRVSARSNAGTSPPKDVVLAESQRLDGVLVEMATGATVEGVVSGLPARGLGGVRIFATGSDYQDSAITGDDGRFTLRDVPAGVLRVSAMTSFPTSRSASKTVDVPDGGEVSVDVEFEGSARLAGRVTRGERGMSGLFISAVPDPPSASGTRSSAQTDENGQYTIEGLADGTYQVSVNGTGVSYRKTFSVSGDTDGDIVLPGVSISGIVTESETNEPIEGASVQAESGRETTSFTIKRAVTDSRGFYSIDDVDSGTYQVTARGEGYQHKTQPATVSASSLELNLQLQRGAGLSIRAVDGLTGLPLRGLTALAYSQAGTVAFSGSVVLDSEGKGEISSLAPGRYSLYLFSDGYASRSFPSLLVPSQTLGVALTPGGRVEVRTEAPLTGRLVEAGGAAYFLGPWRLDGRVTAGPPATVWNNVAPGSYQLIVSGPSGERSYPVAVSEGRTTTVEVR